MEQVAPGSQKEKTKKLK